MERLIKPIGWLMILSGFVPFSIGLYSFLSNRTFVARAVMTQAVVTRIHREGSMVSSSGYPVFRFTDRQGRTHEVRSGVGSDPPDYRVGDRIAVLYDPDDPQTARVDSLLYRYLGAFVGGGLAFGAFASGVLVVLFGVKIHRYILAFLRLSTD